MATSVLANEILEVKFYCTLGNQVAINVRHWKVGSVIGGDGRTDLQIADYLSDIFKDLYGAVMVDAASFKGCTVRCIRDPLPEAAIGDDNFSTGQVAGDALPTTVSGIISLKTGLSGPAYRGRAFIPFPGEASNDASGKPASTYKDDLANLGAGFIQTYEVADGGDQVTLGPVLVRRPNYVTATPLTGALVRSYWGRQKRRDGTYHADLLPF
jgi:hypothetical protein